LAGSIDQARTLGGCDDCGYFAPTERADEVAEKADQQHGSVHKRQHNDRPARSQPLLPAEPKGGSGKF
jgi:hypothetical protein